ncbi:Uncharacterised protein [Vibrio cholerae]|nr:Uncharacterised protein [Vibrio cholerae]
MVQWSVLVWLGGYKRKVTSGVTTRLFVRKPL